MVVEALNVFSFHHFLGRMLGGDSECEGRILPPADQYDFRSFFIPTSAKILEICGTNYLNNANHPIHSKIISHS